MKITIFDNVGCATASELDLSWPDLFKKISAPKIDKVKKGGKLIKLATFGTTRNPSEKQPDQSQWSLKHDDNILTVTGIEADYDAGIVAVADAVELLQKAGIRALVYTSWSDSVLDPPKYNGGPRWRVLAPLSEPVEPETRTMLVARLNGALKGILAGESFTLAQGYFFGKRPGATFQCVSTFDDPEDGTCIDELHELDAIAISKGIRDPAPPQGSNPGSKITGSEMFAQAVDRLGRKLVEGDGRREMLKTFISSRSARGRDEADLWMMVKGIEAEYFDPDSPIDEENIRDLIKNRVGKDAKKHAPAFDFDDLTGECGPPEDDDDGLPFGSEQALADDLALRADGYLRWSPGLDWLANNGTHWERDILLGRFNVAKDVCRRAASGLDSKKLASKICAASTSNAILNLARCAPNIVTPIDEWDKHPMLLNTPGDAVDLETGRPVSRAGLLFTQTTGIAPANMPTPIWDKFISEVFGGDLEMVEFMQRLGGYSLTGSIKEQKLFFLHGQGANGKSVFLDVLRNIGGKYSHNLPSEALMTSRNEGHPTMFASLHGKRLAISSEIEESAHWAESRIKSMTGDETMTARFMQKDFFTFRVTHKHLIAGNFKPRLKGDDFAMVRRMVLVPFMQKFEGSRRDNNLPDKLKAEYGGIMAWFIEGACKWASSGLAIPDSVAKASKEYMSENNDLDLWIAECCKQSAGAIDLSSSLYDSFSAWKERQGEHAPSAKSFSQRLERSYNKRRSGRGIEFVGLRVDVFDSFSGNAYADASRGK